MIATAADLRAAKRALEVLDHVDTKPAELRHIFAHRAETVRLAAEIVVAGRAYMPSDPPQSWIELWGWAITGPLRGGAEMRPTKALVEEFNKQRGGKS